MALMHTTMISASMTAYSTAVGPSSFFKKSTNCVRKREIMIRSQVNDKTHWTQTRVALTKRDARGIILHVTNVRPKNSASHGRGQVVRDAGRVDVGSCDKRGLGSGCRRSRRPEVMRLARGEVDLLLNLLPVTEGDGEDLQWARMHAIEVGPKLGRGISVAHPGAQQHQQDQGDIAHS